MRRPPSRSRDRSRHRDDRGRCAPLDPRPGRRQNGSAAQARPERSGSVHARPPEICDRRERPVHVVGEATTWRGRSQDCDRALRSGQVARKGCADPVGAAHLRRGTHAGPGDRGSRRLPDCARRTGPTLERGVLSAAEVAALRTAPAQSASRLRRPLRRSRRFGGGSVGRRSSGISVRGRSGFRSGSRAVDLEGRDSTMKGDLRRGGRFRSRPEVRVAEGDRQSHAGIRRWLRTGPLGDVVRAAIKGIAPVRVSGARGRIGAQLPHDPSRRRPTMADVASPRSEARSCRPRCALSPPIRPRCRNEGHRSCRSCTRVLALFPNSPASLPAIVGWRRISNASPAATIPVPTI